MTSTSNVFEVRGTKRPSRHNVRLMGSTTNGPKAYPPSAERCFQFGVAHAAPLPTGRSRTFCDAVEVSMDPRAKSIAFACSAHVLQSDTAVTRVDAVPHAAAAHKTLGVGSWVIVDGAVSVLHRATSSLSSLFTFFRPLYRRRARTSGTFQAADRRQVCSADMSFAVEFLSGPQVLMLRVYAALRPPSAGVRSRSSGCMAAIARVYHCCSTARRPRPLIR